MSDLVERLTKLRSRLAERMELSDAILIDDAINYISKNHDSIQIRDAEIATLRGTLKGIRDGLAMRGIVLH